MIMHRLSRGPFVGFVKRHDDGPWRGWYSFTWSAEGQSGGCDRVGRQAAYDGLGQAYRDFFARQAKVGTTPLRLLLLGSDDD